MLASFRADGRFDKKAAEKQEVAERFRKLFSPAGIGSLTEADFIDFLRPSVNKHWSNLSRAGKPAAKHFPSLRDALAILLRDDGPSVGERLDQLRPKRGGPLVPGINKAVLTAILQIAYPDKYGVWNNTSESFLRRLRLWPAFERGSTPGEKYERVNSLLSDLAENLGIDLWTLDALWWDVRDVDEEAKLAAEIAEEKAQGFASDPKIRKAVEERAMKVATEYYESEKFTVDSSKHKTEPYDLECVKGGITLHVEVKGTQGLGSKIILTHREVKHAQSPGPGVQMELCVVHHIRIVDKNKRASGGHLKRFREWNPTPHQLECITYRCKVPSE